MNQQNQNKYYVCEDKIFGEQDMAAHILQKNVFIKRFNVCCLPSCNLLRAFCLYI